MSDLQLLTREQLAETLGMTVRQVRHFTSTGKIPVVRLGHSFVRYRLESVMKAIAAAEVPAVKLRK